MGVALAMASAAAAAVCYGVGSVLQSIAARRSTPRAGLDPRLLARLLADLPYLAGLALDLLGFLAALVALHRLPLFFVQAAITSSVGITVLVAVIFLHMHLHRVEVVSLAVMGAGLMLLAVTARPQAAQPLTRPAQWAVLGGVAFVAILGVAASRRTRSDSAVGLAVVAGLGFTGVGVSARALVFPHHLAHLVSEPLAWAIAGYGVLATLLFAMALQRGSLTTTVALTFVVETVVPAVIGLTVLGDRARSGSGSIAGAGFVLAVTGAVMLARHAGVSTHTETAHPG